MKTFEKTRTTTEPRLVIRYDQSPESPRTWSNLGFFITVDRNYNSPDKNEHFERIVKETGNEATSQDEHMKLIKERIEEETEEKIVKIYPITKYEHSGVVYSLGHGAGFDYSNNGFYIITEVLAKELGVEPEDFEKVIKQEIAVYNKYVNGEVYGFTLYDEAGEVLDSCWGFYDIEDIRDALPSEWKDEDLDDYLINE
jgi:hypothetical protein